MRVITGKARGVVLKTPEGMQTRPTADRVKEALFSIIQFDIPGCRVLDLFGGSGTTLIACEMLGRSCCMMELEPKWCDTIVRRYIRTTGKKTGIRLFRQGEEMGRDDFAGIFSE